ERRGPAKNDEKQRDRGANPGLVERNTDSALGVSLNPQAHRLGGVAIHHETDNLAKIVFFRF
ncbi:hypothetical protein, partial [Gordonibacter sp.]|uniref:hypothetical protein n=2 Tax=Gordonibacter sp. TaxID=1968902 RepID=UPI002FCC22AD